MESIGDDGALKIEAEKSFEEASKAYTYFKNDDVIIAKVTPCFENGKGALVKGLEGGYGFGTTELVVLRASEKLNAKFLYYISLSNEVRHGGTAFMTGAGGLKRVPDDFYLNLVWPLPSISEQIKIVGFLNNEIEKIDALIERQERLVELLNEKRLEVIRHAITKGIDPDVRLKESRIQWIGKVPEGWAVKQLKWITPIKRGASPRPIDDPIYFDDENGEYAWVRISDVTSSNIYLEQTEQKLSALGASLSVKLEPGKLFLSIAGSVGKPCIAKIKACIHDGFVYFPKFNGNNMWLYYMFETKLPFGGLGKMGTQLNLNTDTIGSIYVPMPPENEIEKIISHIEEKFAKFNMLISKSNKSIELLKEHRSSLISAAVTGKIDVREVA
ncbi:restriction endonuclease subunit S [Polynucleobacter sp. 78F-HAINBA]|jgi:type I restriction enzyme S subunit|uniref:restriction endonuclease subunit S n=1 Tax=Polynucleobacter sp. 78F-HAINBA TaxID=2689099 RepID=UPI001C0E57CD|nr:restriction endonuclease subunit S [Polynucleobacter sp. 78F-HAINBA]